MAAVDLTRQSLLTTNTDPGARTNGTFPSEIITPTPSSSAPTQEAVPLEVKPPAEVDKALYQIEFHRKVYGASIDVLETLEKISFQDTYTDSTMRLNIAYLKYWRRGNTQPSAEKTTVVGADTKFGKVTNTKIEFDKNAKFPNTFEIKDIKGWTTLADGTVFKPLTNNKSTPINTAKSAPKVNEGPAPTTQPIDDLLDYRLPALPFTVGNIYQFVNKGQATVGQYGETALSGMNFVIGSDVSISAASAEDFPQVKRLPLTRVEALALLRAELNVAEAATPVDTELVKYLKDTLVKVEAATPEQYTQGLDLPPDPREDRLPTYEVPSQTETVRVADVVGGMDSQYKRYDPDAKVEKTEGIWQFLFNPQTLERSFGPEFKQANTWGNADGNPVHFSGFKNEELRFRDILLNGYMFGRKVESLVEGIRELVSVDVEKGHQSPRVLEFIWGSKTFGPCIMTDITVNEEMWDGGEVVNAKLNFTLKKIPEWLVNDEFVNIFDPVGQPLQLVIAQAPKPAETPPGGDSTTSSDGGGETQLTPSQKEGNRQSAQCITFNKYSNLLQSVYNRSIVNIYSELDKAGPDAKLKPLNIENKGLLLLFVDNSTRVRKSQKPYSENPILKNRSSQLDSAISESAVKGYINTLASGKNRNGTRVQTGTRTQTEFRSELQAITNIFNKYMDVISKASSDFKCGFEPKLRKPGGITPSRNTTTSAEVGNKLGKCRSLKSLLSDITRYTSLLKGLQGNAKPLTAFGLNSTIVPGLRNISRLARENTSGEANQTEAIRTIDRVVAEAGGTKMLCSGQITGNAQTFLDNLSKSSRKLGVQVTPDLSRADLLSVRIIERCFSSNTRGALNVWGYPALVKATITDLECGN